MMEKLLFENSIAIKKLSRRRRSLILQHGCEGRETLFNRAWRACDFFASLPFSHTSEREIFFITLEGGVEN
jgi:hypothetical protein